jgi:hypothetical protein
MKTARLALLIVGGAADGWLGDPATLYANSS